MRILMLETRRGTEDGFTVRRYERGQEYEIRDSLARAFLAAGFGVKVFKSVPSSPFRTRHGTKLR